MLEVVTVSYDGNDVLCVFYCCYSTAIMIAMLVMVILPQLTLKILILCPQLCHFLLDLMNITFNVGYAHKATPHQSRPES